MGSFPSKVQHPRNDALICQVRVEGPFLPFSGGKLTLATPLQSTNSAICGSNSQQAWQEDVSGQLWCLQVQWLLIALPATEPRE